MNGKNTSIKYKGYLIIKRKGTCFLYDRESESEDYPIMIEKNINKVRQTIDKLSHSPVIKNQLLN